MTKTEFFAALNLVSSDLPVARWTLNPTGPVTASARLDALDEESAERYEFGVYETIAGETSYVTGVASADRETGEMMFLNDADEDFFERFTETVRVMTREISEEEVVTP